MKKSVLFAAAVFLLSACSRLGTVAVDLSDDVKAMYQKQLEESTQTIRDYKPENAESDPQAPLLTYVEKAVAETYLGQLGDAENTYKKALRYYPKTRVIFHNLGRLYEKAGRYDLAIAQYKILIDEYLERDYLYDITWAYINAKDVKNAEKYFNAWQLEFHKTDEQTQQAIKKLKNRG